MAILETGTPYAIALEPSAQLGERKGQYAAPFVAYVDLSAKLEQWTKDSAVAVSNGETLVVLVPAKAKQRLRKFVLERHGSRSAVYRMLAVLICFAVKDNLRSIQQIVIDRDYAGAEAEAAIKNFLLRHLRYYRNDIPAGFVRFDNIKGSTADRSAREVFVGSRKPTRIATYEELIAILGK